MNIGFNYAQHLMFASSAESVVTDAMNSVSDAVTEAKDVVETSVSSGKFDALLSALYEKIVHMGGTLLCAILVAVIGWYIVKMLSKTCKKLLDHSKLEESVSGFIYSLVTMMLKIFLFLIVITTLGIELSSIAAIIGSAGLAIGLSLQGCLSNFAGGVLLLVLKPYIVGDYIIDGNGNEGQVISIDIIYTKLLTPDNRMVVIPNGNLSNSTVTNITREPKRRIDFRVSIGYEENIKKVKDILEELAKSHPLVMQEEEIQALVNKFDPSSIDMILRVWVKTEDYWTLKFDMQEKIKETFDAHNVVIPYEQLDVNLHPTNAEQIKK